MNWLAPSGNLWLDTVTLFVTVMFLINLARRSYVDFMFHHGSNHPDYAEEYNSMFFRLWRMFFSSAVIFMICMQIVFRLY